MASKGAQTKKKKKKKKKQRQHHQRTQKSENTSRGSGELSKRRYDQYRAARGPLTEQYPQLLAPLEYLGSQQDRHFELFRALVDPGDGSTDALFDVDLFLLSILNRSIELIDGFVAPYNRWNFVVAAPLVRMQIDNLIRLNYATLGPPSSGAVEQLLSTTPLRKQKDLFPEPGKRAEKLMDVVLVRKAAPRYPWMELVYEKSSGWVHFSANHVDMTARVNEDAQFFAACPPDPSRYSFEFVEQVLWAMNQTTLGIASCIETFVEGKRAGRANWPAGWISPEIEEILNDLDASGRPPA